MTARPLLEASGITVRFEAPAGLASLLGRGNTPANAVDGVDLDIEPGEVLGIVGESGSGKTTLGKVLLRLHRPKTGRILFEGQDITGLPENQLRPVHRRMQMVFQDPLSSLNPRHTVGQTLEMPLRQYGIARTRRDLLDRSVAMLESVGLSATFAGRYPHEMSGGQLQRVAIGRAMIVSPALIVADEAVSKLDVSVRAKILNLFRDRQRATGIALIFITHDLRVARFLCDRIAVMYYGKIIEVASARELFSRAAHPYTEALVSTLLEHSAAAQAEPSRDPRGDHGCRFSARCPIRVPRCLESHPPLSTISALHQVACHVRFPKSVSPSGAVR